MRLRKPNLIVVISSAVLALYYAMPLLLKLRWWGVRDWDLFTAIAAIPVGEIVHYGQFPFWNPYMGGGNILFHHPEVAVLTPFFLLYLVFGAVVGLKLQVLICYFLGFWGSQRLFRTLGMSRWIAVVAAVAYFGSVHLALHYAEGHMPFTHYAFLPWFVHFVLESVRERRYLIGAVVSLALMILGNGAAVPFLYTMLFTGLLLLVRAIDQRTLQEIKQFATATVLALLVSAVKVIPMIVYLVRKDWEGNPEESIPLTALDNIFFGFSHSLFVENFPEQFWAWHEYGAYISPLLAAAGVYLLVRRFRKYWYLLVPLVFFFLLGMGNFASWSPWAILTQLPGFESLRATGRAFHFVILSCAVLGGLGLDLLYGKLREAWHERGAFGVTAFVALVIVGTNLILVWPILSEASRFPPKHVIRSPVFRHVIDTKPKAYENFLANRGALITPWLSAYEPSRALVGPGERVEQEFVLSGSAEIKKRLYTPNKITYVIEGGKTGGRIVIGMGYERGWYAEDGRELRPERRLISFQYTGGTDTVVLRYRTPNFYLSLAVSLLTLAGLVVFRGRLFGGGGTGAGDRAGDRQSR